MEKRNLTPLRNVLVRYLNEQGLNARAFVTEYDDEVDVPNTGPSP